MKISGLFELIITVIYGVVKVLHDFDNIYNERVINAKKIITVKDKTYGKA